MKEINLKPMLTFQGKDLAKAFVVFWLIIFVVTSAVIIMVRVFLPQESVTNSQFSIYEVAGFVMALVTGIVAMREDLRMALQHGIGRPTFFISHLITSLLMALLLSLGGVVLYYLGSWFLTGFDELTIQPLYHTVFHSHETMVQGVAAFVENRTFDFSLYFIGLGLGTFLSILFYRLNKPWNIAFAVALPVSFILFVSYAAPETSESVVSFPPGPWTVAFWMIIISCCFMAISWLLLRKASVKPI
jgi:hypothetical protein